MKKTDFRNGLFLLVMNLGPSLLFSCKRGLNPRFQPTIRMSLTTPHCIATDYAANRS